MSKFGIDERTALLLKKHPERLNDVLNSLNYNQQTCKKWLMKELLAVRAEQNIKPFQKIDVIGSWYGNILVPLIQAHLRYNELTLNELDEETARLSKKYLLWDYDVKFRLGDATQNTYKGSENLIINTSAEHMAPIKSWKSLMCIQSNNYREVEEHINCVDSAEELADMYGMNKVYFAGALHMTNYTRFMVIGRRTKRQSEDQEQ